MGKKHFDAPLYMPATGEGPGECFARALPLAGTPGQTYVEKRGVALEVANAAGIMFSENFGGRPAVLAGVRNRENELISVHGRYLTIKRNKPRMFSIGPGDGIFNVFGGWRTDPLILVEGMFDALSLATCGFASAATLGQPIAWLYEVSVGRLAWLAFDAGKPGEKNVAQYKKLLKGADTRRLKPPPRCKDWSTALNKLGPGAVERWLNECMAAKEEQVQ